MSRVQPSSTHHITIPNHDPIKTGTLASILREIQGASGLDRDELLSQLFGISE
jgi:hypothetical protein